ncbi:MAG TPA: uracil-DNA glycosylase [Chromatiales bacterium]|nr:uracil-DNA glycosylase [Chromatiales bacterium]
MSAETEVQAALRDHQSRLRACRRCPQMIGPPVTGLPVVSPVMLVGQAPGPKEIEQRRPFAWTAGKTLFGWFSRIGLDEQAFRRRVYMAAVCRCFPGKRPTGGDRVPSPQEVANCAPWLNAELDLLHPRLILPTGRLAIGRFLEPAPLTQQVGRVFRIHLRGFETDVVPLPHPSGASPWHRTEPGKTLLERALATIARHEAWRAVATPSSGLR